MVTTKRKCLTNYAMLVNIRHIKLINFRAPRVQGKLCYNPLTPEKRHNFQFNYSKWHPLTDRCNELKSTFEAIVRDWGAFLDFRLDQEALVDQMGGENQCLRRVKVSRKNNELGTHLVRSHSPHHFFLLSAMSREANNYKLQLEKLLKLTQMKGIQWINFKNHEIHFITIS